MVGAVMAYWAALWLGWTNSLDDQVRVVTVILMLLFAMSVCGALGFTIERFAYRPLRKAPRLNSLITAIGISMLLGGVFQLPKVFGASPRGFPEVKLPTRTIEIPLPSFGSSEVASAAGRSVSVRIEQLLILGGTVFFLIICRHVILRTRAGLAIRATSFHHDHARLMGVSVDRITSFTFVFGSALAAIAGVFVGLYQHQIDPLMGVNAGLKAFTAAVVGGIGNLAGAVLGGFIMGLSETYIAGSEYSNFRDAFAFVLLIVILLVRPGGLLGSVAPEKV
jgi:branched-chain amino acid transport system permease protein